MNIIVDAFGGDNAPLEVIRGCRKAVDNLGINIILTGDENKIKQSAKENNISLDDIEIAHTAEVFDIHEEPSEIIKSGKETSLGKGLQLLSEDKGDAFVCAGSTGALVVGSTFIAKRIKGVKRAFLAPILPTAKGHVMLLDAGANVDFRPEMLVQSAIMASAYMEKVMGIKSPRVGLINVGAEETKGRELEIQAYKMLSEAPINFGGNLEARELPKGEFDVAVSDGFTGNVVLKLYEGMGSFFAGSLKGIFSGFTGRLSALPVLGRIRRFKKQMDYTEVGGAVLMGISKPVIKAHGSSDANAFYNAVRQAKKCVDGKVIPTIKESIGR
ncbi:MAG: phosphate acyltransferase PlsX [Ruminococcus sp.]|nr:phosphate acyltransferase PlsX [Ruminococcus sp.]